MDFLCIYGKFEGAKKNIQNIQSKVFVTICNKFVTNVCETHLLPRDSITLRVHRNYPPAAMLELHFCEILLEIFRSK